MSRFITLTPVYLDEESDPVDILATAIFWIQPQTFYYRPKLGYKNVRDHPGSTVYFATRSLQVIESPARVKELIDEAIGPQLVNWSARCDRAALNPDFKEVIKIYAPKPAGD